jgi:hypothetical protein
MTLYPEWFEKYKDDISYPERLRVMHASYGTTPGKVCKNCIHLRRYHAGASWLKCELTKSTQSSATDWKAGWPACGKYEESQKG